MAIFRSHRRFADAPPLSADAEARAQSLGGIYAAWAARRGFSADFVGIVLGHQVRVRPGLEGSRPVGVEAEIALEHGFTEPVLLKPTSRRKASDVAVLFDEVPSLRSIGIFPGGVRLRLKALVPPDVVDGAIDRAISLFQERARTLARTDPYR